MQESTLTQKGQTTVPQPVRDALHVQPGARLCWHLMPDGAVIVRAKSRSILDMAGMLRAPAGKKTRVADMNAWPGPEC
ncbi:MAG: type II toxin-antitoxin system PrlF family antitoxin [Pseudomonadota bacterium]|nr:type II toxin-antitoxin system PrlF family antitoxin [Pseudomonadota bacterium]